MGGSFLYTLAVVVGVGLPCPPPSPGTPSPDEVRMARGVRVIAAPGLLDSLRGACFVPRPLQPQPLPLSMEDSP